jgi:hypothetical protein
VDGHPSLLRSSVVNPLSSLPLTGRTTGEDSVHDRRAHNGSRQDQIRLCHTSTTGRPPRGRSRTVTARRSFAIAITPQAGQPVTAADVSTSSTSPATSAAAST